MYRCVPARISRPFRIPPRAFRATNSRLTCPSSSRRDSLDQAGLRPPQRPVPRHVQRLFLRLRRPPAPPADCPPRPRRTSCRNSTVASIIGTCSAPPSALYAGISVSLSAAAGICTVNPSALRSTVCHAGWPAPDSPRPARPARNPPGTPTRGTPPPRSAESQTRG